MFSSDLMNLFSVLLNNYTYQKNPRDTHHTKNVMANTGLHLLELMYLCQLRTQV